MARLEAHDPAGAEQSFAEAVRLYEELAEGRSRPGPYRAGLALALYGRGYVRWEQGRRDEARADFARVAALGDELAGGPEAGGEVTRVVADARRLVADDEGRQLEEKARLAERKCEEAQVKEDQAPAEAEGLYREAIALWEEVLPRATSAEYRKATVVRLAVAHLNVALQQERQRKFREAEAAARQSVAQGERAVAQEPDRPLPRHNLDLARQTLDRLRQEALQEEIDRLCAVGRFADAADASQRGIDEEEERFRSGKDREAARRALAYRLDHFAWFLAHCADGRVRDPKAAVRHARRATELQPDVVGYWYTLARAQYRNGDWKDSLASLEHLKNAEGGFDALGWLLTALDRQQLGQKDEARDALRKGVERIEEMRRKAEDDARLRWQYERMRPSFESQRREAEQLIEGKGPADTKVG